MAWGAIPAVARVGIFAPIIGFISALFSRFLSWFLIIKLSGALYRVTVAFTFFLMMYTAALSFVNWANNKILEVYNAGGLITQTLINGIASFLPTYTPIAVSVIVWYYFSSITLHLVHEAIKFQQRLAEKATERFLA